MKHKDFLELLHLAYIRELPENPFEAKKVCQNGFFVPAENMDKFLNELEEGEVRQFKQVAARDLKLHRAYFAFISFIYSYLPQRFKDKVQAKYFYRWLQCLKGDYEVIFTFKDERQLIDYESISFARMDEKRFREYIKEQIPFIYEDVIMPMFNEKTAQTIIDTIEEDFEKFLTKLFAVN